MAVTFITMILKAEDKNATGISVPAEVVAKLGKQKRPPVKVNLNGYTYCSIVAPYGDVFMLPVSQEHREAAGVRAGDQVEVTLELDLEPRTIDVPDDLAAALSEKPRAGDAFDALSFSACKEYVLQVESVKASDTRNRRIAGIVAKLSDS